jgi:hypothetical protein
MGRGDKSDMAITLRLAYEAGELRGRGILKLTQDVFMFPEVLQRHEEFFPR